jgi:hypothetical protein
MKQVAPKSGMCALLPRAGRPRAKNQNLDAGQITNGLEWKPRPNGAEKTAAEEIVASDKLCAPIDSSRQECTK